ncbi:hypothetical protein FGO68_gene15555 [Halteria grandinella]|uniref:Uncharacterized protein n=1 Tax=Halteria grandinella TaxID=5974 RepID=A0A8J8NAB1_HALGN|nr:hypothetical protein FGO68_gene15555 [Halteria grandinella]
MGAPSFLLLWLEKVEASQIEPGRNLMYKKIRRPVLSKMTYSIQGIAWTCSQMTYAIQFAFKKWKEG